MTTTSRFILVVTFFVGLASFQNLSAQKKQAGEEVINKRDIQSEKLAAQKKIVANSEKARQLKPQDREALQLLQNRRNKDIEYKISFTFKFQ